MYAQAFGVSTEYSVSHLQECVYTPVVITFTFCHLCHSFAAFLCVHALTVPSTRFVFGFFNSMRAAHPQDGAVAGQQEH